MLFRYILSKTLRSLDIWTSKKLWDNLEIAKWFIQFSDFHTKTVDEIAEMIENVLQKHGIDIKDCKK